MRICLTYFDGMGFVSHRLQRRTMSFASPTKGKMNSKSRRGAAVVSGVFEFCFTDLGGRGCDAGTTVEPTVKVSSKGVWISRTCRCPWQVLFPAFLFWVLHFLPEPNNGAWCPQSLSKRIYRSGFYSWPSHTLFSFLVMFCFLSFLVFLIYTFFLFQLGLQPMVF